MISAFFIELPGKKAGLTGYCRFYDKRRLPSFVFPGRHAEDVFGKAGVPGKPEDAGAVFGFLIEV
jgi:hypothetical protein